MIIQIRTTNRTAITILREILMKTITMRNMAQVTTAIIIIYPLLPAAR